MMYSAQQMCGFALIKSRLMMNTAVFVVRESYYSQVGQDVSLLVIYSGRGRRKTSFCSKCVAAVVTDGWVAATVCGGVLEVRHVVLVVSDFQYPQLPFLLSVIISIHSILYYRSSLFPLILTLFLIFFYKMSVSFL